MTVSLLMPPEALALPVGRNHRAKTGRAVDAKPGPSPTSGTVDLTVIVPVFNEESCVATTVTELYAVLEATGSVFEVIVVDDGSTDNTPRILKDLNVRFPGLRRFAGGSRQGQSAAFGTGFRHARGRVTVLMDADGQNDPRDIPRLLSGLEGFDACCGVRTKRRDTWPRRAGGKLANRVRNLILHDEIIDTGCSLKAIRTEFTRDLPMNLAGMHRFIPTLLLMRHARIRQIEVNHRLRSAGLSKYGNWGRLRVTVHDLIAVRWMQSRQRVLEAKEQR